MAMSVELTGGYIAKDCVEKNVIMGLMGSKFYPVINQQTPLGKGNWKIVQFKSLFHIPFHGRPTLEYEMMYDLFANLKVPNNPNMHWPNVATRHLLNLCTNKSKKPLSKPYNLPNSWVAIVMR